jgi:hypothetical protein
VQNIAGCLALALLSLPAWAQAPSGWQMVKSPKPLTPAVVAANPLCILGISFNASSMKETARAIALSLAPVGQ